MRTEDTNTIRAGNENVGLIFEGKARST